MQDTPRDSFPDLGPLLCPGSIGVIGASEKFGAGSLVIENLRALGFQGRIVPINPRYRTVLGMDCYPSLEQVPHGVPIDCVAVVLGSRGILPVMAQAARRGVRGAWAFASGFAETGDAGAELQQELGRFCRNHGILFCGPNCVGYVNLHHRACMFSAPVSPTLKKGDIGVVAQSGSVALAIANSNRGIGFSTIVSSGNEAVLDMVDYIEHFLRDDHTRVIAAFIEGIRRPEAFKRAAVRAADLGKPIIVVKVGRSDMARKTAVSHTGALAGSDRVHDAFFEKYGVIRVEDLDQLLETAAVFAGCRDRLPAGNRVGMITVSGGEIGLVGDASRPLSLVYPPLSTATREHLARKLPDYAAIANPLDAWGSGDLADTYGVCLEALAGDTAVDVVAVSQDAPLGMSEKQVLQYTDVARAAVRCAAAFPQKPLVVFSHVSGGLDPTLKQILDAGRVPFLQGTRESLTAIDHLTTWAAFRKDRHRIQADASPPDPTPMAVELERHAGVLGYELSRSLLQAYGIGMPAGGMARSADAAARIAARIGYPVALKGQSPAVAHKTEAGLVRLDIGGEKQLRQVFGDLAERLAALDPDAAANGLLVQAMVTGGAVETIVGISTDPLFGPVVALGLGGVLVELLDDVRLGLPPLGREAAASMVRGLKGRLLLEGFRGAAPADRDALVRTVVQVGRMARDLEGIVRSVDINPLMVLAQGKGVVAVDVLVELNPRSKTRRPRGLAEE